MKNGLFDLCSRLSSVERTPDLSMIEMQWTFPAFSVAFLIRSKVVLDVSRVFASEVESSTAIIRFE